MATLATPSVSVEEYLRNSYHPDCDYVDGALEERNLGELDHGEVQGALAQWFRNHGQEWNIRTIPELRIRVGPTRFRVADIALLSRSEVPEQVVTRPPLAVIEVLSREDRVSRYQERLDDYQKLGVQHIWVVDPQTRRGFDCSSGSWIATQRFAIDGSPISVDLSTIFAELDPAS